MLGPLNSLVWYVPSLRYTRGLGWHMHCGAEVTESSTNKKHHLTFDVLFFCALFFVRDAVHKCAVRLNDNPNAVLGNTVTGQIRYT